MHVGVHLRTLFLIQAQHPLAVQAVGPEAPKGNIGLGNPRMRQEKPEAKDWLGKNVQHSISNDLAIDRQMTGSNDGPDAKACQQCRR